MNTLRISDLNDAKALSPSEMTQVVGGRTKEDTFLTLLRAGDTAADLGLPGLATAYYHAAKGVAEGK